MRGHALPLPYLDFPSISFLIFLSPRAYLTLLRTPTQASFPPSKSPLPKLDISFHALRSYVSTNPRPPGVTTAALVLGITATQSYGTDSLGNYDFMTRPTFPLHPAGDQLEYTFIEGSEPLGSQDFGKSHKWFLDFTDGGKRQGVVMSQTRMRDIETIVNPLNGMTYVNIPVPSFNSGSWIDLLVSAE